MTLQGFARPGFSSEVLPEEPVAQARSPQVSPQARSQATFPRPFPVLQVFKPFKPPNAMVNGRQQVQQVQLERVQQVHFESAKKRSMDSWKARAGKGQG